jgi:SAM-dependent methyltransferase
MNSPDYMQIVNHYEACLAKHGTTHQGLDWPNMDDLLRRYQVMLDVIDTQSPSPSLLDLGCGFGMMVDYIKSKSLNLNYTGIDLSAAMIVEAKKRHPKCTFDLQDVLKKPIAPQHDYVILNGVLTVKSTLPKESMTQFAHAILKAAYAGCKKGIAFNVMSTAVDWQRDDLFHWGFDEAAQFITTHLSKHFSFRQDYGLYEYTAYVYRSPTHER